MLRQGFVIWGREGGFLPLKEKSGRKISRFWTQFYTSISIRKVQASVKPRRYPGLSRLFSATILPRIN